MADKLTDSYWIRHRWGNRELRANPAPGLTGLPGRPARQIRFIKGQEMAASELV